MPDVDRGVFVRVGNEWKLVDPDADPNAGVFVRVGGTWKTVESAFVRVNGTWKQWWPKADAPDPPDPNPPTPGVYELNASSSSIGSSFTAWAEFNIPSNFIGHITLVRCIISWLTGTAYVFQIAGRPSGGSINRDKLAEYQGRTIYHNVSASTVQAFNSGAAKGFTLTKPSGVGWNTEISSIRAEITVS